MKNFEFEIEEERLSMNEIDFETTIDKLVKSNNLEFQEVILAKYIL